MGTHGEPVEAQYKHDLFVSYAGEDVKLVEPLVKRLREDGVNVWFAPHNLKPTSTLGEELWDVLSACRQALICLSDYYFSKDYTILEMTYNFRMDPANRRNRTIPVVLSPVKEDQIPPQIKIIPWLDLTNSVADENQYERLKSSVLSAEHRVENPTFPSPVEVTALRKMADPDRELQQAIRYAREILAYVHGDLVGGQAPESTEALARQLLGSSRLPSEIKVVVTVLQTYVQARDMPRVEKPSIEPCLAALLSLSRWAGMRYRPAPADPFVELLAEIGDDMTSADFPYQLKGGMRRLIPAGAVYSGESTEDKAPVDLLVAPLDAGSSEPLRNELRWCATPGSPLPVRGYRLVDSAMGDQWCVVSMARPQGTSLAEIQGHSTMPALIAAALLRATARAFHLLEKKAPGLGGSLFSPDRIVVDLSGQVRLSWNWETAVGDAVNADGGGILKRDKFSFCQPTVRPGTAPTAWADLRGALDAALVACSSGAAHLALLRGADTANELLTLLPETSSGTESDAQTLLVVVECVRGGTEYPKWTMPQEPAIVEPPPIPPPPEPEKGFGLFARLETESRMAWPVGDGLVVNWDFSGKLELIDLVSGARRPCAEQPFRHRCSRSSREGRLALGGWDGQVRVVTADGTTCGLSLAAPVGDVQWLGADLIVGAWNGRLVRLPDGQASRIRELVSIAEGVRTIAVSGGESFAVLGMHGIISVFRGDERVGQTLPIPDAEDLAFAGGRLVALTARGLITITSDGTVGRAERPPARGAMRLLTNPGMDYCLLAAASGESWKVDNAGTYPRGPRWPECGGSLQACVPLKSAVAERASGFAYWRGERKAGNWPEAVSAQLSADGLTLVVVQPDSIEVYRDKR